MTTLPAVPNETEKDGKLVFLIVCMKDRGSHHGIISTPLLRIKTQELERGVLSPPPTDLEKKRRKSHKRAFPQVEFIATGRRSSLLWLYLVKLSLNHKGLLKGN